MARFVNHAFVAGLIFLVGAQTAHGFGGRGIRVTSAYCPIYVAPVPVPSVVYYLPAPRVYLPAQVQWPEVVIIASPPATAFAIPTPAPPSQTSEPPLVPGPKQAPKVSEARSEARVTPEPLAKGSSLQGHYRVGFWNLSDRDLTVKVDGRAHLLTRGRGMTVSLARQFVWQIDQREPTPERIPEDKSTLEIVIRH